MTGPHQFLDRLPRTLLIVGKGGVGKTTCAAGLAMQFTTGSARVLVVTTDPAGTLANVIAPDAVHRATMTPVSIAPGLDGWFLDTAALHDAFLHEWRETIATILDRGTYLDRGDIDGLIDAALPGAEEVFALLALAEVIADTSAKAYDRVLIDTAPTGHTLRLLDLPTTFRALVDLLDAMQEKHRFMVRALTHRYRRDRGDALIDQMRDRIGTLSRELADPARAASVLVARAEPVVIAESARYLVALDAARPAVRLIIVNVWTGSDKEREAAAPLLTAALAMESFALPRVDRPPATMREAGDLLGRLAPISSPPRRTAARHPSSTRESQATAGDPAVARLALPLTIVGGKGGVGKTTVACALAIVAADAGERVLLVSTDPAPSIADALAQPIGDEERQVEGVERLMARQMDAAAAFSRLRDEYRDQIDDVFSGMVAGGLDAAHDRAILRDLLSLSPPGIDELYALSVLGEALDEAQYSCIIVDPAPTAHLLRLLDMSAAALDWSHRLMRLLLKYKEVVRLGDTAEALLGFARRTKNLDARLHDPAMSGIIGVLLDEPLVRTETTRLVGELRVRPMQVVTLVWNRSLHPPALLRVDPPVPQVVANNMEPSPVGVAALRAWAGTWTRFGA